ncbi:MAG: pantetheine-phosphate adenylyltransferase [Ferruginibacter sp.]
MQRVCLFPGTFDPITIGHVNLIERALPLFDLIHVGVGINTSKKNMFSIDQRIQWIRESFAEQPTVIVSAYEGLTIDHCRKISASFILRGLRQSADFEYEKSIADTNRTISGIDTLFLNALPEFSSIASVLVRDLLLHGGNTAPFLPKHVQQAVANLHSRK